MEGKSDGNQKSNEHPNQIQGNQRKSKENQNPMKIECKFGMKPKSGGNQTSDENPSKIQGTSQEI